MEDIEVPKFFCIAPWVHTYLSPQGERRLCCASREESNWQRQYIDLEGTKNSNQEFISTKLIDHWNSEKMKSIRKRILNNEKIPECQVCNDNVLSVYTYKDYFTKTLFPKLVRNAIENTSEDGYTTLAPISFDYRVSNLCSFKCRMCGELFSSAWESEKRLLSMWNPEIDKWMTPENKKLIEEFRVNVAEKELWQAAKNFQLKEIYWVGGEPLSFPIHWDIMEYLTRTGQSKDIVIRYNTNLNSIKYRGVALYDILPSFKNINICASIDATGEIGEWIRTGLNWKEWLNNFKAGLFLNDIYGKDAIVLDVTITLPGLLDLKNLIKLAVELNVKSYVKLTFEFDPAVIMSPLALPREILNSICDDLIEYESIHGNEFTKIYSETLKNLKGKKTFQEKYPNWEEGLIEGKHRMKIMSDYRKDQLKISIEDIFKLNQDVLLWWNSINEKI